MKFDEGEVDELTRALFHDATVVTNNNSSSTSATAAAAAASTMNCSVSGGITFDALKAQLTKHDGLLQNLSISIDRWLVPPKPKKPASFWEAVMTKVTFSDIDIDGAIIYLIKGATSTVRALHEEQHGVHCLYGPLHPAQPGPVFLQVLHIPRFQGMMVASCHMYIDELLFGLFQNYDYTRNWWIILARACGQCLNFTSMFILVLMLRHCITKLRELGLAVLLPLDRHIYFHKVTGRLIVIYSIVHTGAHLGNLCKQNKTNRQCQ